MADVTDLPLPDTDIQALPAVTLPAILAMTPGDGECMIYRAVYEGRQHAPIAAMVVRQRGESGIYLTMLERVTEGEIMQTHALIDPLSCAIWLGMTRPATPWRRDLDSEEKHIRVQAWVADQQRAQQAAQSAPRPIVPSARIVH